MLIETYRGWRIYYSSDPRPLWATSKGMEKDIYSYESLEAVKSYINKKMLKDAQKRLKKGLACIASPTEEKE